MSKRNPRSFPVLQQADVVAETDCTLGRVGVALCGGFWVMHRINPAESHAYRRSLPVRWQRLVAPRLLLLTLFCVAYPAVIASGTLALTHPSTGAIIAPCSRFQLGTRYGSVFASLFSKATTWRYAFHVIATLGATWFAVRLLQNLGVYVGFSHGRNDSFGNCILQAGLLGVVLPIWVTWSCYGVGATASSGLRLHSGFC